ncbi:MAG: purine/pyrimidine permease [Gemmatimonadota bacterium]|nr:purine/pyrimidine permease [Gemmatimonadota bacterium]
MRPDQSLRYEAADSLRPLVSIGLGTQLALLSVHSAVLLPTIVFGAANAGDSLLWAIFGGMLACGVITAVQAVQPGRLGSGYQMLHGCSAPFIAVCVAALAQGGAPLLATLVFVSGMVHVALSRHLALLHRVFTPIVTGTVIMLLPVTIMPIVLGMLNEVPAGAPAAAGPLSACVTIAVAAGIHLKGPPRLRLWAPVAGLAAGSLVAAFFGIYDFGGVAGAAWVGLPAGRPPGLDLGFGPAFWALLPSFVFIALVGTTKAVGVAVATQRVSWRSPRAVDFRSVQGAVAAEGGGNILASLAGGIPNTLHPTPVATIETTGVASRSVGFVAGLALVALACFPKLVAVIIAIPDAVVAAVIIVTLCTLFVVGMREVVAGIRNNPRSGLIAGLAIWTGIAIEFDVVFPDFFTNFAGGLLNNGMTTGGILAILLVGLTIPRVARFRGRVDVRELPQINEFIRRFARRSGLEALIGRMEAAAEETLLMLVEPHGTEGGEGDDPDRSRRALLLTASHERGHAVMRFKAATAGQEELNLQDRLAWLGDEAGSEQEEQAISLRLLRHLASSVRHQQYHNVDIVTLKVAAGKPDGSRR